MKVTRMLHAAVNTGEKTEAVRSFYEEVMELELADRPEIPGIPGSWFNVDDSQLHIVGFPPMGTPIDPTGHHICFGVENLADAVAELASRTIDTMRGTQGPNGETEQIWFLDPAGNTIEIQQDPLFQS